MGTAPTGATFVWWTATPPGGYIFCDNNLYSRSAYPNLFNLLGTQFGKVGDDPSMFRTPPGAGNFMLGANSTYPLGSTGGEATHLLVPAEIAAHVHPITDKSHVHGASSAAHGHTATSTHGHSIYYQKAANPGPGVDFWGITGPAEGGVGGQVADAIIQASANVAIGGTAVGVTIAAAFTTITSTNNNTPAGSPHNNVPQYVACNWVIKT